jgi:hypothetical protein
MGVKLNSSRFHLSRYFADKTNVTIALATASVASVAMTNEKHARKIHQARDQSSVRLMRPTLPEMRLRACCVELATIAMRRAAVSSLIIAGRARDA